MLRSARRRGRKHSGELDAARRDIVEKKNTHTHAGRTREGGEGSRGYNEEYRDDLSKRVDRANETKY